MGLQAPNDRGNLDEQDRHHQGNDNLLLFPSRVTEDNRVNGARSSKKRLGSLEKLLPSHMGFTTKRARSGSPGVASPLSSC